MPSAWPTTLPAHLINSFQETPPDNVLRTSMDKGPAKLRRRTTTNTRPIRFSMILTPTQLTALDTFYATTTRSGADEFDYKHPRTNATVSARFANPPSYSDVNGRVYRAEISLEILP